MKIVQANKQGVKEALLILKQGGVIVYPTETAYGLGADFFNPQAVRKIYQIKGRKFNKSLSVLVSSLSMARKLVKFDILSQSLAKKHWPGPLTLVLEIRSSTLNAQHSTLNTQTLGLRISSNKLATAIVRKLGRPMTATSANLAGQAECYSAEAITRQFKNKKYRPDLFIDGGKLPKRGVSTVIKVEDKQIKILRKGGFKKL